MKQIFLFLSKNLNENVDLRKYKNKIMKKSYYLDTKFN